jgi:hypothetical protein
VEEAEGMYTLEGNELKWQEPEEENVHVEVSALGPYNWKNF